MYAAARQPGASLANLKDGRERGSIRRLDDKAAVDLEILMIAADALAGIEGQP